MKLARNFILAIILATTVFLAGYSYLTVQRELKLFDNEMRRDAHVMGLLLAASVRDIQETRGFESVLEMLDRVNEADPHFRFRWVRLDVPEDNPFSPQLSRKRLVPLLNGKKFASRGIDQRGNDCFFTYVPITENSGRPAALEVAEKIGPMKKYLQNSILRNLILLVSLVFISSLLIAYLGVVMIGKPINELIRQTRQVSSGNLEVKPIGLKSRGELSDLGEEFDKMLAQLRISREKLEEETTRRIRAMEKLSQSERLAAIGELASVVAHQLGTPLNVVLGRAKMITSQELSSEEILEGAEIIKEQSDRMTTMIRQLLTYTRRPAPQKSKTNLEILVQHAIHNLEPLAQEKGVNLHFVNNQAPAEAQIDTTQIEQVINNLVMNSVQAMPDGGTVHLVLESESLALQDQEETKQGFCLSVQDEGTGIPAENLDRVFKPFFTTKSGSDGTGLGLAISMATAQDHGGWLEVKSEPGKGATFSLVLPLE